MQPLPHAMQSKKNKINISSHRKGQQDSNSWSAIVLSLLPYLPNHETLRSQPDSIFLSTWLTCRSRHYISSIGPSVPKWRIRYRAPILCECRVRQGDIFANPNLTLLGRFRRCWPEHRRDHEQRHHVHGSGQSSYRGHERTSCHDQHQSYHR